MKSIRLIVFIVVAFLMMGCPDPNSVPNITYTIFIYYKNDKGENLLDPSTDGHYQESDIKINGSNTEFSIDTAWINNLPKGYALYFIPKGYGSDKEGRAIITLTSTDTLISRYSGETLVLCTYNGKNVLPSNMDSPNFPVEIVKRK